MNEWTDTSLRYRHWRMCFERLLQAFARWQPGNLFDIAAQPILEYRWIDSYTQLSLRTQFKVYGLYLAVVEARRSGGRRRLLPRSWCDQLVGLVRTLCRQIRISSPVHGTIYPGELHIHTFHQHFKQWLNVISSMHVRMGKSMLESGKYLNLYIAGDIVLDLFLLPLFLVPSESLYFIIVFLHFRVKHVLIGRNRKIVTTVAPPTHRYFFRYRRTDF